VDALHESSRCRLLDVLGHRHQLDAGTPQRGPDGHVVFHGTGQAIDLVDDDRTDLTFGHPSEHGPQHGSIGGARGLAGVGELTGEVPAPLRHVPNAGLPLSGDRVPLAGLVLGGLLLRGDPEVDHRIHRSPSSSSCPMAIASSTRARARGRRAPCSGAFGWRVLGRGSLSRGAGAPWGSVPVRGAFPLGLTRAWHGAPGAGR
jgi:hypothetical protein